MSEKGVNKVTLVGRLGKDPETKGKACRVSLATAERRKDNEGEWQDHTEWHSIVFFGKLAEVVEQYTSKGDRIYLEGKLRTTSYEDDNGNKKYSTQIVADELVLLGEGKKDSKSSSESRTASGTKAKQTVADDDIPF